MSYFKEEIETVVRIRLRVALHCTRTRVQNLKCSKQEPTNICNWPCLLFHHEGRQKSTVRIRLHDMARLDSSRLGSICLVGSLVQTTRQVIQEITSGLLLSHDVNFLWVAREDIMKSWDSNIFPDGFQDDQGHRAGFSLV